MSKAIVVQNVTKKYKLYNGTKDRLLDLISPKSYGEDFHALANVNFEANTGEVIGFIGINGSGKSTLSNIIAGIVPETSGKVKTNGQVSLIAVAAGLKNDLTGRDNIELKLLMLGFDKKEIKELEEDIIEFAELEKFIDQPVKSYSSGMKSRLGFAISVNVDPDILIIDEALSVGDKAFAEKSLNKMKEFKQEGKTMIFVSHSIGQMKQFCEKILWLEYGMVKEYGTVEEVIPKYESFLKQWKAMGKKGRSEYRDKAFQNQDKILKGLPIENSPVTSEFVEDDFNSDKIIEKPVSLLGQLKSKDSYLYDNPKCKNVVSYSVEYKLAVYYIKRKADYKKESFYLISTEPSGNKGIIGWIKAEDIKVHPQFVVDFDKKTFYLNGAGKAFEKPWGSKKDCIYDNLSPFKDCTFIVSETNLVGKNAWYRGKIANQTEYVWIHRNFLKSEHQMES